MGNNAGAFAYNWVGENISADVYASEGDTSQADVLVVRMLDDAVRAGISRGELEDAVGDLAAFIASAMENATDEEVRRLAADDD
jgi:regulator of protease activity HflC (stomatin/prohibitin superfamily)